MSVLGLGYIGLETAGLEDWSGFATDVLGLQQVDKTKLTRAFRMDDRKQRFIVNDGAEKGPSLFGWEVADHTALLSVAAKLEADHVTVTMGTRALAQEREVQELIVFKDPMDNQVEVFHGPLIATDKFIPGRAISGFRTGVNGMGHIVFMADSRELVDKMSRFYIDLLGFSLTDYYSNPFEARFLHVNPRHHSLAIVQSETRAFHHLMMELYSLDDVGQGYDLVLEGDDLVAATLGRHTSDYMTSFYTWTPSRFMIEYGWGGRSINPDIWEAHERAGGPSYWGHERSWASAEIKEKARQLRLANGKAGNRAPIQVMEGNYQLADGACPWWDGLKANASK
ncbi:MAG: VOC family protein [Marinosulfonomonas sp.]|nr:VOC family protein [Marinosulfonomonas sp.]